METPVVLLVFNRPDATERLWRIVRSWQPSTVVVVADGPRRGQLGDVERCQAVRAVFEAGADWPCEIIRDFSPQNLGCGRRIATGLDRVFDRFERAIILEDDCVPDLTFHRFCCELLEFYSGDDRVAAISGDNFMMGAKVTEYSYYFSRYPHCWGWATWRRAWRDFDYAMRRWPELRATDWLMRRVASKREYSYWRHAFDLTMQGRIDSWAYPWTFACWLQERVTVLPAANLVANVGFGPEATHTRAGHPVANLPVVPMQFPLVHPPALSPMNEADARTAALLFRRPALLRRLLDRLTRAFL